MRFQYIAIHVAKGLSLAAGTQSVALLSDETQGLSCILTAEVDALALHADRHLALAELMLRGVFRGEETQGRLDETMERIRATRKREHPGPYLVLTGEGEMESLDTSQAHEDVEFVVGFDLANAAPIRSKYDRLFVAVNLSLCARFDVHAITKITDKVVYFRDDGKPVYSFKFQGGAATLFVSRPPSFDELADLVPLYQALSADESLSRVQSLIQASMDTDDDKLRAFLAAYTALEIFVYKQFKEYEAKFFREIEGETPSAARKQYLKRIRDVMQDKYGLRDRFSAIAFQLAPDAADDDLKTFGKVARRRNDLAHGEPVDEPTLPVTDARNLAIKYLRLHVSRSQREGQEQ